MIIFLKFCIIAASDQLQTIIIKNGKNSEINEKIIAQVVPQPITP